MAKQKQKSVKTQRVTNEQIENEVLNPIITAGVVTKTELEKLSEDELKRLKIRKKLELELIKAYDKIEITRHECYEETVAYMPGPVSSSKLHDTDGNILPNLRVKIDYRGVPPTVYYIFVKLYGRDRSPEITRYLVDIYGIPVEIPLLVKIQYRSQKEAMCQVNRIRPQWVSWEVDYSDDEDEDKACCCGWITKEHLEVFIYWAVRCWAGGSKSRKGIKYSSYKPLRGKDDSPNTAEGNETDKPANRESVEASQPPDGGEASQSTSRQRPKHSISAPLGYLQPQSQTTSQRTLTQSMPNTKSKTPMSGPEKIQAAEEDHFRILEELTRDTSAENVEREYSTSVFLRSLIWTGKF